MLTVTDCTGMISEISLNDIDIFSPLEMDINTLNTRIEALLRNRDRCDCDCPQGRWIR